MLKSPNIDAYGEVVNGLTWLRESEPDVRAFVAARDIARNEGEAA